MTQERRYFDALLKMNHFLKRHQVWQPDRVHVHGGICGSFPIYGDYGKYEILSWAVKFFIDALLMERSIVAAEFSRTTT
jgi:hypothetical protein